MMVTSFIPVDARPSQYAGMNSAMPSCCDISMAVRSGTCHLPSASMRKPSFKASNNSVTSRTCLTSSRDSINMVLFPFPLSLLNPFDHPRRDISRVLDPDDVHTLKRIHYEIRHQTEFVILPFSRCNFERLIED